MTMDEKEKPAPRRFSLFSKPLSKSLTQFVGPIYKKHGFAEHRILTEWSRIVGDELAAVTLPQKLTTPRGRKEGGTLYVLAAQGRALELQHMQPVILDKIATYFGYRAAARLHVTQSSAPFLRKKNPAPKPAKAPAAGKFPVLSEDCADAELRRAFESLSKALAAVEN